MSMTEMIENNNGQFWMDNGTFHREDGPAKVYRDGDTEWWRNGKRHRIDGPALIWRGIASWWINNRNVTKELRKWAADRNIDLDNLTDEDKCVIIVEWTGHG
jgi:hypothetical protein